MQWSPFQDKLLATSSDDATIKLWVIDSYDGIDKTVTQSDMEFDEHAKKCKAIQWHPICENVLASYAEDNTIRVWDVNTGDCATTFTDLDESCHAIRWSPQGDLIGATVKRNKMCIFDPRQNDSAVIADAHKGPRAQKFAWIDNETFVTSGFNPQAQREFCVWDLRKIDEHLAKGDITDGTGVSHIDFDREHDLLFNVGRGDSFIQYWQFDRTSPRIMTPLDTYNGGSSQKGFTWMPKWACDVDKHEIRRGVRITDKKTMEILAFRLPSKSGLFQADLYPAFAGNTSNNNFTDWMAGTDKPAVTMELRPEKKSSAAAKAKAGGLAARLGGASQSDVPVPTGGESVEDLKKEIADLKAKLAGGQDSKEDLTTKPKLGYWDIRGLGSQIRYMFAYCKVDYEYVPYKAGPGPDFDKTCWTDVKHTMGFEYPNLPYLEDGKTKITETFGIMKYIAKKYDPSLLGRTAADLGRIEMLSAHVGNLKGKATMPCYVSGDVNEITENCRPILKALVDAKGNSKWIAGNDLSWLDFAFAELLDMLDKATEGVFYQEFPAMKEYFEAFVNLPGMAEYWQTCQKAPFNNTMAKILNK